MPASHQDVQLAFYRDGLSAVEKMIEAGEVTGFSLRRALREMEESATGVNVSRVDEFRKMLDKAGFLPGKSGISKPEPGDIRSYKVQQGKSGKFIRGPVDHMDVEPGDNVRIRFTVGGFVAEEE